MATARVFDGISGVCHRYGPGRLPRADDSTVGAGYAGATAALFSAVVFAGLMILIDGRPLGPAGSGPLLGGAALVSVPVVVPTAFVATAVVWRFVSTAMPHPGLIGGLLAVHLTYLLAFVGLFGFSLTAILTGVGSAYYGPVHESLRFAGGFTYIGFLYTAWFTVPIGCFGGYIYEHVGAPA
ncbi:hypothetical protein G6M89_12240 [Natronolimnobius sp. AArcel1]|uniref:hypothetical protein n=1 Tax=Natronolimnobius sp. AArcel1 TaxID=1679093 RepID=UPI0013E9C4D4|nr:hypothetical protein [Natronolimnobius sp. AArcel1]NGM69768.1 hypothetical protein [Natronolimnobius sp. AArcel1]